MDTLNMSTDFMLDGLRMVLYVAEAPMLSIRIAFIFYSVILRLVTRMSRHTILVHVLIRLIAMWNHCQYRVEYVWNIIQFTWILSLRNKNVIFGVLLDLLIVCYWLFAIQIIVLTSNLIRAIVLLGGINRNFGLLLLSSLFPIFHLMCDR